jgi:EmrB/QacA subfamily drug resistance transporter
MFETGTGVFGHAGRAAAAGRAQSGSRAQERAAAQLAHKTPPRRIGLAALPICGPIPLQFGRQARFEVIQAPRRRLSREYRFHPHRPISVDIDAQSSLQRAAERNLRRHDDKAMTGAAMLARRGIRTTPAAGLCDNRGQASMQKRAASMRTAIPTTPTSAAKQYLPWVVATALLMEQLDSTIVNTAIPSMAVSLHVTPLSLKAVVTSYILALAVCIPVSGWMADRYGTRRVFSSAVAIFTVASVMCALSLSAPMLVATRVLQGIGAAMMMPVGRLTIVRTFPKEELLRAMNFVIIPALIGPLLGPTVGGLIVHWLSWRVIFFVNVPVGLAALYLAYRHMPDYHGDASRPLDLIGLVLFGTGTALLSWLLEVFGEHSMDGTSFGVLLLLSLCLLGAYVWHARQMEFPLLRLNLFNIRTFRASVVGGFITRLGVGGLPFLLPLLYQLGLGLPAWQSGLLMMPSAAAAMGMKFIAQRVLARFGYRQVLVLNTVLIGVTISMFSLVKVGTPIIAIVCLSLSMGFFNSLQFSSMNTLAFADVTTADSSMASTIASSMQQLSMSFGLAAGSLITGWYLNGLPQSDRLALTGAIHYAFITLAVITILSSLTFWTLRREDGEAISKANKARPDLDKPEDAHA